VSEPTATPIAIAGLVKIFGTTRALDGLDLEVRAGEVHALLGPNGAGKTTTIRVLLGLLRAASGNVALFGGDPWRDGVRLHRRLAYAPGDVSLWPNLSGGEAIDLLGSLRGGVDLQRRGDLLRRFELDPTKRFGTYSKGNRQKVALVAALASDVELYILDEPTSGLDPLMQSVFESCIAELKAAGRTVLLSSHILAEVEALADRVTIIRAGKAVESGTLSDLRHLARIRLSVEAERPLAELVALPGVYDARVEDRRATFDVDPPALNAVLAHLSRFGVRALTAAPPTLEALFLRHYGADDPAADRNIAAR
jgi:ABC-2 type transport system ATP-binding protein